MQSKGLLVRLSLVLLF